MLTQKQEAALSTQMQQYGGLMSALKIINNLTNVERCWMQFALNHKNIIKQVSAADHIYFYENIFSMAEEKYQNYVASNIGVQTSGAAAAAIQKKLKIFCY